MLDHEREKLRRALEGLEHMDPLPTDDDALKLHFVILVIDGQVTWEELEAISYVRNGAEPEDWPRAAWKSYALLRLLAAATNQFQDDHREAFGRVVGSVIAHLDTDPPCPMLRDVAEAATERAHQHLRSTRDTV